MKCVFHVFPATYAPRHFLHINPNGSYYEFLKDYATNSPNAGVQQYWQNYSTVNDHTPSTVSSMLHAYDTLDYQNLHTRLIVAIFYLSAEFNFNPNTEAKENLCQRMKEAEQH